MIKSLRDQAWVDIYSALEKFIILLQWSRTSPLSSHQNWHWNNHFELLKSDCRNTMIHFYFSNIRPRHIVRRRFVNTCIVCIWWAVIRFVLDWPIRLRWWSVGLACFRLTHPGAELWQVSLKRASPTDCQNRLIGQYMVCSMRLAHYWIGIGSMVIDI